MPQGSPKRDDLRNKRSVDARIRVLRDFWMAEADRIEEGGAANVAVEAWLRALGAPPAVNAGALLDLRLALARVCEADLIRRDHDACRLLRDMSLAEDMDDLHAVLDRLGERVAKLLGDARDKRPSTAPRGRSARHLIRI